MKREGHCHCGMRVVWNDWGYVIEGNGRDVPWYRVPFAPGWMHWTPGEYDHPAALTWLRGNG